MAVPKKSVAALLTFPAGVTEDEVREWFSEIEILSPNEIRLENGIRLTSFNAVCGECLVLPPYDPEDDNDATGVEFVSGVSTENED